MVRIWGRPSGAGQDRDRGRDAGPGEGDGGSPASDWSRSAQEIDAEAARLAVQTAQIAARKHQDLDELTTAEHYTLGVRAASRWTTGRTAAAPLLDQARPADVDTVVQVMALADDLMTHDDTPEPVAALAAGIRAWLL